MKPAPGLRVETYWTRPRGQACRSTEHHAGALPEGLTESGDLSLTRDGRLRTVLRAGNGRELTTLMMYLHVPSKVTKNRTRLY